jgi:hypothetical protein
VYKEELKGKTYRQYGLKVFNLTKQNTARKYILSKNCLKFATKKTVFTIQVHTEIRCLMYFNAVLHRFEIAVGASEITGPF